MKFNVQKHLQHPDGVRVGIFPPREKSPAGGPFPEAAHPVSAIRRHCLPPPFWLQAMPAMARLHLPGWGRRGGGCHLCCPRCHPAPLPPQVVPEDAAVLPLPAVVPRSLHPVPQRPHDVWRPVRPGVPGSHLHFPQPAATPRRVLLQLHAGVGGEGVAPALKSCSSWSQSPSAPSTTHP